MMKQAYSESADHMNVEYVAHLARLELTGEECRIYQEQLDDILEYVQTLNEVDVEGVEPMAHPLPRTNVLRSDTPAPGLDREQVLANAPQARNQQFVVPLIVE